MSSSDLAVSVRGLSKSYTIAHNAAKHTSAAEAIAHKIKNPRQRVETETFWALRDVEFEIAKGDVVGIIGRNGAGKSTLLKILSRITEPTTGQIDLYGRVGSLLEVGTGFHPELTGRENVYLNGAILGMNRREIAKQFDEIVAFAEVEQFLDTPVKRYSSGMYVRLAFAVAAHLEPEILIVDEVLAVGDAVFQKKCLGKMQDVASHGRTVLFVSHNMGPVRALCHRALWLSQGRIHMASDVESVIDAYVSASLQANTGLIELHDAPRVGTNGQQLRIQRVEINHMRPVKHGELLNIRIYYAVTRPVENVSFSIGFSTLEGTRLITVDTDFAGERLDLEPDQSGFVDAVIETLPAAPGHYLLDIGARSGDIHQLDFVQGFCQAEVVPGRSTPAHIIGGTTGVRQLARPIWNFAPSEFTRHDAGLPPVAVRG